MGRVNWDEAELWYISDSRMSYAMLAAYYRVSKPTIQAHGTKHKWKAKREEFKQKRANNLLSKFDTNIDDVNARHLAQYRLLNTTLYNLAWQIAHETQYDLLAKAPYISKLTRALNRVITEERVILGLPVARKRAEVNHMYLGLSGVRNLDYATDDEVREMEERFKKRQARINNPDNY